MPAQGGGFHDVVCSPCVQGETIAQRGRNPRNPPNMIMVRAPSGSLKLWGSACMKMGLGIGSAPRPLIQLADSLIIYYESLLGDVKKDFIVFFEGLIFFGGYLVRDRHTAP